MTVKSGGAWAGLFVTLDATGALAAGTPAGVLYVDGVADGATVTITGSNPYKFSVTLPSLTAGQRVDMYITATISTIATAAIVASEQADTSLLSDVKTDTAAILADTGTDGVKLASGAITAAVIATDAIDADAIKADAITEIQSGLALEATLTAIKGAGWTTETLVALMTAIEAISVSGASAAEVWAYAQRYLSGQTDGLMVIGPVRNDGKIDALAGDDYYAADGRSMEWSDTAWPNLTGATVKLISGSNELNMTVVTAGTGEQTVRLEVSAVTSALMKGEFKFIIRATLASTHVVTLLEGEGRFK